MNFSKTWALMTALALSTVSYTSGFVSSKHGATFYKTQPIQMSIMDRLNQKRKEKKESLKESLKEKVKDAFDDFRTNLKVSKMEGLSERSEELARQLDQFTTFVLLTMPSSLIAGNENARSDEFIVTEEVDLGWVKTGEGFSDWDKKFIPATTFEITDDLSIRMILEDDMTGEMSKVMELSFDVLRNTKLYPIEDVDVKFESKEEADQFLKDFKLHPLPDFSPETASPPLYNDWGDITTDESFSRFWFHGIGAALLATQSESSSSELGPIEVDMPIHGLEMREGFRPYGARINFNTNQEATGIYDYAQEKLVKPGDDDWESAKFLAKTSCLMLLTAREHLLWSHLIVSNTMTLAMIKRLSPDHPIRRLLTVFTFRANYINSAAFNSLVPENSFYHRMSGFSYKAITEVFESGVKDCIHFHPFGKRDLIPELQELSDTGRFPFHSEGNAYYNIVRDFVASWIKKSGAAASDEMAKEFYEELRDVSIGHSYELPEFSEEALIDTISQCIFVVTCYHEIIGTIVDYTSNCMSQGTRMRDDETVSDVQGFAIFALLTASTGAKVPMLIKPFDNYFGEGGAPLWEKKKWNDFLKALEVQSAKVQADDEARDFEFKFFDPSRFECSISV